MIEIPAVIRKDQIAECHRLIGQINGSTMSDLSTGDTYVVGQLVFRGFAGAIDLKDRLYHGVFRFEPNRNDEAGEYFTSLPQATDGQPAVVEEHSAEVEVSDGV